MKHQCPFAPKHHWFEAEKGLSCDPRAYIQRQRCNTCGCFRWRTIRPSPAYKSPWYYTPANPA